jgi:transposase
MDRVPLNVPLTDTAQAKPFQRVEVITGLARRRRWSEQDKAKIVAESLEPGVIVADVARRYGLHRNQLYDWRAAFGIRPDKSEPTKAEDACSAPTFVPVTVVSETPERQSAGGLMEIMIGSVSVRLTGTVDVTALRQVLEVIRSLA